MFWAYLMLINIDLFSDARSWMAGLIAQQCFEWYPCRWDGSWKDYSDNCLVCLPYWSQKAQWTIPCYCSSLVSTEFAAESCEVFFFLFYFYWSLLICVIYRTLSNWLLEFEKWTPSIIVVSYKVRLNFSKTSGYPTVSPVWSLNPQTHAWQSTALQPERFRWLIIQLMFSCRVHPTCVVQLHLKSGEESSMLYLLLMSMWWKTSQSSQR